MAAKIGAKIISKTRTSKIIWRISNRVLVLVGFFHQILLPIKNI